MGGLLFTASRWPREKSPGFIRVLYPPGVEAIVVVLARDFAVLELEPHREVRAHVRILRQRIDGDGEHSRPEDLERDAVTVDDRVHDLELLSAEEPAAFFGRLENRAQVAVHADRRQPVRELFL